MELQVNRRGFVGALAAGVPLLAASAGAQAPHRHDADPVGQELRRQLKGSLRGLGGPRHGEASRRLAGAVRIAVAHGAATDIDAQFSAALKQIIRSRGRHALIIADIAPARLAAEAKELGIAVPTLLPFDYNARSKVLDDLLKNGVTATWTKAADAFEVLGAEADKQFVGIKAVRVRLPNPHCIELSAQLAVLQDVAQIACNPVTLAVPAVTALCSYTVSIWAGFRISYAMLC